MNAATHRWLEDPTFARISGTWADGPEAMTKLLDVQWTYVAIGQGSLCGIAVGHSDDAVAEALAPHTKALRSLDVVHIRSDVAVVVFEGTRSRSGDAVTRALSGLGATPVAVFVGEQSTAWVVDGWHRPALETALGSATSVSG